MTDIKEMVRENMWAPSKYYRVKNNPVWQCFYLCDIKPDELCSVLDMFAIPKSIC